MSGQSTSQNWTNQSTNGGSSPSPWVQQAGQSLYSNLAGQYPNWTPYSGPTTASFGQGTTTAQNAATAGLSGNPNQTAAGNTLSSVVGAINPNATASSYMNPYVQATLDPTIQNLDIQAQQQHQQNAANATMQGAYGGTGQGVQDALTNRYLGQNIANASGSAYSNAYNSAVQQQQANLGLLTSAGAQQTGLGSAQNQNQATLATLLAGIGGQQQAAGQTGITNAINLNAQNQNMPLQQGSTLASILGGLPQPTTTWGNTFGQGQQSQPNNAGFGLLGSLLGNSSLGLGNIFSDARLKEDIAKIGETRDGQNIYSFRYKGDPVPRMGLMAQEVEQRHPEAVIAHPSGFKMVDYEKATADARRMSLNDMLLRIAA